MTSFWWQLTHNITIHTVRLSLKESCLKIHVKNVPSLTGCHLATYPKSRSCGGSRICLLIFLLFVLETSQYPSCFCLDAITLFVRLDRKHPSSGYIIPRFVLSHCSNTSRIRPSTPFRTSTCMLQKLLVIPSRYNDRCTDGMVVKLHMSC